MKVRHLHNATVTIEVNGTTILCDPWLEGEAYYGSWAHYPPTDYTPGDFDDVDYIYISHIHPDHAHMPTLKELNKDIPVLIHDFRWDFLRKNIERLGFDVTELPHGEEYNLNDDFHISILASDDCDPEVCGAFFGCPWYAESKSKQQTSGSTQIDTLAVFDDGEDTIVNANDCRWPLTQQAAQRVIASYDHVDLLMVGYRPAHGYPQCRSDYSDEQKKRLMASREEDMLESSLHFVNAFDPEYYMPFAGSYVIAGKYSDLNAYLPSTRKVEAKRYFEQSGPSGECILLNSGEWFDITEGAQSAPYVPLSEREKNQYIDQVLTDKKYTYEADPMPDEADFEPLVADAYSHFEKKRQEIGYESDTRVYVRLLENPRTYLELDAAGNGYDITDERTHGDAERTVTIKADPRLVLRILKGPEHAHFNNAVIGSHLEWSIRPDTYERALFYCLNFLHS